MALLPQKERRAPAPTVLDTRGSYSQQPPAGRRSGGTPAAECCAHSYRQSHTDIRHMQTSAQTLSPIATVATEPSAVGEPKCGYVVGLKASRARVEHAAPGSLVRRMLAEYGRAQLFEWYQASTVGKVVFDVDGKAGATTAPALLQTALAAVATFFGHMPDGVVIASSHGGEKLSYRIFVLGFRMTMSDIKKRIIRLGLDKNRPFDTAIYSANQKLRMVGSIKTPEDARVLKLIDAEHRDVEPTRERLLDTVVQVVDPSWPLLEEPPSIAAGETSTLARKRSSQQQTQETQDLVIEVLEPVVKRPRGRPPNPVQFTEAHSMALAHLGFVNPTPTGKHSSGEGVNFNADNRTSLDPCPCCNLVHTSNQWWLKDVCGQVVIANYSDHCRPQRVTPAPGTAIEVIQSIPAVQGDLATACARLDLNVGDDNLRLGARDVHTHTYVVTGPRETCPACQKTHAGPPDYRVTEVFKHDCWTVQHCAQDSQCTPRIFWHTDVLCAYIDRLIEVGEAHLATIFLRGVRGQIVYDEDNQLWYMLDAPTRKWKRLANEGAVRARVVPFLHHFLIAVCALPKYAACKPLLALIKKLSAPSAAATIMLFIKGELIQTSPPKFDADPYLFACNNCVIDLRQSPPLVRQLSATDYVTVSTTYDYDPDAGTHLVEKVFSEIYPVQEERNLVRKFAAYCLFGHTHHKLFMALTDRRSGDNGKSTVAALLKLVLDEQGYWAKGKNPFITQAPTQSANAHDAGTEVYRNKRLAVFEELDRKHGLNSALLKDLTGGGDVTLQIRRPHATKSEMMPWTAKILMIFNESNVPKMDGRDTDDIILNRALLIQHRSYFAKDDAKYQARHGQPYLFRADKEVLTQITPSAVLNWILPVAGAVQNGFEELTQCGEWKQLLRQDNSDVLAWAADNIISQSGKRLLLADAWRSYQASGMGQTGRNDFRKLLKAEYNSVLVSDRKQPARDYLDGSTLVSER